MATKQLKVVRPGRYGTRMLKAGDAFDATAPEARLYVKLGWMAEGKKHRGGLVEARVLEERPAPPSPSKRAKPQLDHDSDGKAGGSQKGEASTRRKGAKRRAKKA